MGVFNGLVYRYLKYKTDSSILSAQEMTPEIRKEINRIFRVANRRIIAVKATGQFSPAVAALETSSVATYRFTMKQFKDSLFSDIKHEYAKAVAFLQQPTSTVAGTKQYNNYIKDKYNLTAEEYQGLSDNLMSKFNSLSTSEFVANYLKRYKDFTGELESEAKSSADQMESDAIAIEAALEAEIEAAQMSNAGIDKAIADIFKGFNLY